MSKPLWHIDHMAVEGGQDGADPFLERRRFGAQVYHDIVNRSTGAPHQFRFRVRLSLVVHTTQRSFFLIERHVALDRDRIQPSLFKLAPAPGAGEEPALVAVLFEMNFEHTGETSLMKRHVGGCERECFPQALC